MVEHIRKLKETKYLGMKIAKDNSVNKDMQIVQQNLTAAIMRYTECSPLREKLRYGYILLSSSQEFHTAVNIDIHKDSGGKTKSI